MRPAQENPGDDKPNRLSKNDQTKAVHVEAQPTRHHGDDKNGAEEQSVYPDRDRERAILHDYERPERNRTARSADGATTSFFVAPSIGIPTEDNKDSKG